MASIVHRDKFIGHHAENFMSSGTVHMTNVRMRRYCASKKASAEILKLWATRGGRT